LGDATARVELSATRPRDLPILKPIERAPRHAARATTGFACDRRFKVAMPVLLGNPDLVINSKVPSPKQHSDG